MKKGSTMSAELELCTPEKKRKPSSRRPDLATVPSSSDSNFTLPCDWLVDGRTRATGTCSGTTDKYYHEPGTGRIFRSLASVKRYLTGTGCQETMTRDGIKLEMPPPNVSPLSVVIPGVGNSLKSYSKRSSTRSRTPMKALSVKSANQIVVYRRSYIPKDKVKIDKSKSLKLPNGWYIKRNTRRSGHSIGKVDKYYCERATGQVFRSLIDVQRYLADNSLEENTTLSELLKPAGLTQMSRSEEKEVDDSSDMAIAPHSIDKYSYSDISDDVPLKNLVQKYDDGLVKVPVRNANDVPLKDCSRKASDDVPLKHLIRKADEVPLNDLEGKSANVSLRDVVQKSDDVPLNDLEGKSANVSLRDVVQKSDDVPLNDFEAKSADVSLKDVVRKSDDVPLKDHARKSTVARKARKLAIRVSSPKNAYSCTANTSSVDISNPPMKIKWVLIGPGGADWSPFTGDTMVPESLKQEWAQMLKAIVIQKNQDASNFNALD